jgi:ABC-type multidrug transport system ATPase subunit
VLILDEPTQGIDVGAKSAIHALMTELAERGVAILMISSELPEIPGMSDRICVMRGSTIPGSLDRAEATQEKILTLALGSGTNRNRQLTPSARETAPSGKQFPSSPTSTTEWLMMFTAAAEDLTRRAG